MSGDVHVQFCERPGVRFPRATHLVVGCQRKADADQFLHDLRERMSQFALELHPDKTRLVEFGRFAMADRRARGERRPETFDFPVRPTATTPGSIQKHKTIWKDQLAIVRSSCANTRQGGRGRLRFAG